MLRRAVHRVRERERERESYIPGGDAALAARELLSVDLPSFWLFFSLRNVAHGFLNDSPERVARFFCDYSCFYLSQLS